MARKFGAGLFAPFDPMHFGGFGQHAHMVHEAFGAPNGFFNGLLIKAEGFAPFVHNDGHPMGLAACAQRARNQSRPHGDGGLEGFCHVHGIWIQGVIANLGIVCSAGSAGVKIDTHVYDWKNFGGQGMGNLCREGPVGGSGKAPIDVLSIRNFPTEE